MSGEAARPAATWFRTRRLFLAGIGLVYAVAFLSLARQVEGLFESGGVQPVSAYLAWLRENGGPGVWKRMPTLFWLDASDRTLATAAWAGVALGLALAAGLAPRVVALAAWVLYLSFESVGAPFLSFQWDALLLESGLLAAVWAPGGLLPFRGGRPQRPPSRLGRWLVVWLLFRLMLLSGLVKLASRDAVWWDLTALEWHYWTQPLPHRLAWFADHLPDGFQRFSCAVMFAIELALPCAVFGPRRAREVACAGFVALMVLISATGNYGFFNLLTVVLCVPLLDDRTLGRLPPRRPAPAAAPPALGPVARLRGAGLAAFAVLVVLVTSAHAWRRLSRTGELPAPLWVLVEAAAPLGSFHAYGLFADMTEERPEIELEGSADGALWRPYVFRYKPGDVRRAPVFAGLHMPRLDWQMWFAALRGPTARPEGWYVALLARLLEGSPPVLGLLEADPFPDAPPRWLRSTLWRYRFGSPADRAAGVWWRRELVGPYCPTLVRGDDGSLGWDRGR